MIIYSGTKEKLNSDIVAGTLAHKISDEFVARLHYSTGAAEYRSWENSLREMNAVLQMSALPDDVEIAVEFQIPLTSKRVDFMIAGLDENGQRNVVVVELKQWQQAQRTSREGLVTTYVGGARRTVTHPSYQAYSYAKTIENFSATVQDENISLSPCAYLHNYDYEFESELSNGLYYDVVRLAPFYMKNEGEKLKAFIEKFIKKADRKQTLYEIDFGKIRPSKALQDAISSMLKGNEEFVMIDEQKVVYSTVKKIVEKALKERKKYTVIVQGGPGTGKSVVAMNLLVALKQYNVSYVTKTPLREMSISKSCAWVTGSLSSRTCSAVPGSLWTALPTLLTASSLTKRTDSTQSRASSRASAKTRSRKSSTPLSSAFSSSTRIRSSLQRISDPSTPSRIGRRN